MNYNTKYTPGSYVFMAFSIIGFIVGIICSGILFIRKWYQIWFYIKENVIYLVFLPKIMSFPSFIIHSV